MQQELQDIYAWVCLERPSTHMLFEIYHSSLQTFLDRQEKLQESREVLSTLKAKVSFQAQSLAVKDCGSPLAECKRDICHAEMDLVRGSQQTSPLYAELSQPGLFIQGVQFLRPWGAVCHF